MKRLNIILIAEEEPNNQSTVFEAVPQDLDSQVNIINQMLRENPSMAEDAQVKQLIQSSEQIKEFEVKAGIVKDEPPAAGTEEPPVVEDKKPAPTKSPLSTLPFFKEDGVDAPQVTPEEIQKLTPETFHELATKLGVDVSKEGWVGETVSKLSTPTPSSGQSDFEKQYNELAESITALPKEVATIVNLAIAGKDWRSGIGNAAAVDLSKDFNNLTATEKIKIHNYYFPEDAIKEDGDITDKQNAKSVKAAEAKYNADKFVAQEQATKAVNDKKERDTKFKSSVSTAVAELKKEYPDFREKDLKEAEEIAMKGGIYHEFFDKDGNLKPDGLKKLIFAKHGANILKVATAIAENKGKNKGKAEVLDIEPGVDKSPKGGGTELTNMEKGVNKIVKESFIAQGNGLTY